MALEQALLKILVCPVDKGGLLYFEEEMAFYNPRLRRRYPSAEGVPVLLAQQAETVGAEEHSRLLQRARSGAAVETAGGASVLLADQAEPVKAAGISP